MSQENANNSCYKYLKSLQETSKSTFLSQKEIVLHKLLIQNKLDPGTKLYLFCYECLMCARYIMEIREDDMCEHDCCRSYAPRIHCHDRDKCKILFVHILHVDDLESQQKLLINTKQSLGLK
ncbi:uncharacterized protein LOC100572131 [Acyrthosiphon pisum]|uniref:ACYPI47807 protein n=1 Tax=Acyrthosiphon pisum TaxID=7029 RepID=C4WTU0_ACYPI|nr:uncharacterized protein LOC100572131 [Acyrthosiphon pisum]BAH71310.1 ACYPI47807 [Acyrthosiphon pisum]|eukprot:NP_001233094.1 uncharacterized protein LOC100572131 [Acyrthosiphon pisum]